MAIVQAVCTSFKQELMQAMHNFTAGTGHAFKIALFKSTATLGAATTTYSTTEEHAASGNYTQGGQTLTNVTPTTSGTTAYNDFSPDITWASSTITANGALIYNSTTSPGTKAVVVLAFGSDKTSTAGDFTIVFPAFDSSSAIIRIA